MEEKNVETGKCLSDSSVQRKAEQSYDDTVNDTNLKSLHQR